MLKIELNLSEDDLQRLVDVLERYVSDLSMEIADTDTMDYRDKLKSQRISIYKVIDQLKKKES
ncbi:MAG: hypothetical protein MUE91_12445 [Ignavibacteriaceae bacterium]|jgi:hypothetical protein|nr:hypothetical protein [Ignavibacteriaceae bacterium]MCU0407156.1 hypothetical protein [Ignavibacteriaceae bacterium]MCU0415188.1 hypothetical protein [Ignavibacteriaceae bacterium]